MPPAIMVAKKLPAHFPNPQKIDRTPNANPLSFSGTASAMKDEMEGITRANEMELTTQHHSRSTNEKDNPTPAIVTALRIVPKAIIRGLLMCITR